VKTFFIATGVGLIPLALCVLLLLSGVERGRRRWALLHPVQATRALFAEPDDPDEEELA
jgi:hypothetical protein